MLYDRTLRGIQGWIFGGEWHNSDHHIFHKAAAAGWSIASFIFSLQIKPCFSVSHQKISIQRCRRIQVFLNYEYLRFSSSCLVVCLSTTFDTPTAFPVPSSAPCLRNCAENNQWLSPIPLLCIGKAVFFIFILQSGALWAGSVG